VVITDETVDGELCATDFLGQAEHGYKRAAVFLTNSRKLADDTLHEIESFLKILPTADTASVSWAGYCEVILCDRHDEMLTVADDIASEHVQVMMHFSLVLVLMFRMVIRLLAQIIHYPPKKQGAT
jgi:sulfopropanediol 3-dehydrogenase